MLPGLGWVATRGHEEHPIERQMAPGLDRNDQMTEVDGVERATKDAQTHR